ncbi:hypothetical protein LRY64_00180 [Candidatus Woesebacteria bacterium]|nr:hypothetical protein [Candidatus Woesebacteria bacterium]
MGEINNQQYERFCSTVDSISLKEIENEFNRLKETGRVVFFAGIEGLDGSGKGSTVDEMVEMMGKTMHVVKCSFPLYESPTGQELQKGLNEGFPGMNIAQRAELYAHNRLEALEK